MLISFYYWPPIHRSHKMVTFCLWPFWGLSLDQIVGSTEFNNELFLIQPTILVSLILASQVISCPLYFHRYIFMQNIPISKTLFVYHSSGLTWSKPGTFSLTDVRLARTWPSRSTLSYPCPTYLSNLFYPISFPWNSIFGLISNQLNWVMLIVILVNIISFPKTRPWQLN